MARKKSKAPEAAPIACNEAPQANIIRGDRLLAERYEVTDQTIADWRAKGMPKRQEGRTYLYDTAATDPWVELFRRSNPGGSSAEMTATQKMRLEMDEAKKRRLLVDAQRAEREERQAQGNLLDREEYVSHVVEHVTIARDALLRLPQELCRLIEPSKHATFREECRLLIEKALNLLKSALERGPDPEDQSA